MCEPEWPQPGRERMIVPPPVGLHGSGMVDPEPAMFAKLDGAHVMMIGDNPALPRMPERPGLMDFFRLRFSDITSRHLLTSGAKALAAGENEKVVMATLLHDISNGCLVRSDHGYWGAQMIGPYVDEEVAWAVQNHQALRYFADEAAGYKYPESYIRFFGADYVPPDYIRRNAENAKKHRWYMTSRLVPEEGLGFDASPVAHMWRTAIWPNNFL